MLPAYAESIQHDFVFVRESVKSVSVAGMFNGWDAKANPMVRDADGKTWRVTVPIQPGKYQYKIVVDGNQWIPDPRAERTVLDGGGNTNSLLLVLPADYSKTPGRKGDGLITSSAFLHQARKPFQCPTADGARILFHARRDDLTSASVLVNGRRYAASRVAGDEAVDVFAADVPRQHGRDLRYSVQLKDGSTARQFGPFSLSKSARPVSVPRWASHTVAYQIFPERFANGDRSNDPKGTQRWDSPPTYSNFLGGDLAGVRSHVDYLKALGVGTVYLTPVFEGPANHGYETTDYSRIDPRFGTNEELKGLASDLHSRGMRLVLDGVFNHSGRGYFAFQDILKNQAASQYTNWYSVQSFPVTASGTPSYEGWNGHGSLPRLKTANPDVQKALLKDVSYWNQFVRLDGWRLDVAQDVHPDFWKGFRKQIRKDNPSAWSCGEIWTNSSDWLQGDMFDSVMNYPFREAVIELLVTKSAKPSEFLDLLTYNYYGYAPEVSRNLYNLVSSHDTPRFKTLAGGDERLQRLAATIQFTWPGLPAVYYGEEIGMEGGADPANRRGMRWDIAALASGLRDHYSRLATLKRSSRLLAMGEPVRLFVDDTARSFAYARVAQGYDPVLVVVNASEKERNVHFSVSPSLLGKSSRRFFDILAKKLVFCDSSGNMSLTLQPMSASVLQPGKRP